MRRYSFFTILLLCLSIVAIDVLAFYWLRTITRLISLDLLVQIIHALFWFFTIGLVSAILYLKIRLESIDPKRRHVLVSSLYGLTISSFIPKIIFVLIISILYVTNYAFAEEESLIIIPLVGLLSGVLPFGVILFAIFKSLYRFKVLEISIDSPNLPEAFTGFRIVHISDIHVGSFNSRFHIFDRAVQLINKLEPDIICFTGDLVNNFAWELVGWKETFKQLKATQGKYAVLGNHDYGDYHEWESQDDKTKNLTKIKDFFNEIGFTLLLNEAREIKRNKSSIVIAGVENWGKPPFKQYGDLTKAMQGVSKSQFTILLSHDPTHWTEEVLPKTAIHLTLSGHTHGMQAGIAIKTKKWSPIKLKYKHWAGLYQQHGQYLYVNRGLGWIGFPGRLGMRPEITRITLKSKP